jgi:hypothetical protein
MSKNNQSKNSQKNGKTKNSGSVQPKGQVKKNKQNRNSREPKLGSASIAYSTQQVGRAAQVKQRDVNCIVIKHRELIGNVSGAATSTFTNAFSISCNPGLSSFAPWLSIQAQGWETYRFRKLKFEYFTRTATTTVGSVVMAPDYDAADDAPPTEQIMSTYKDVVEDAPWKNIVCHLGVSSMHPEGKRKFIRNASLAANLDIKTYDVANFFLNTVDSTTAASWGKLWVDYEVELHTPQSLTSLPTGLSGGRLNGATSLSGALPFGTGGAFDANAAGLQYDGTSGAIILQKSGTYILSYIVTGTVMSAATFTFSNATQIGSTAQAFNAAATSGVVTVLFTADEPNARIFPALTATTVTACIGFIGVAPMDSFV